MNVPFLDLKRQYQNIHEDLDTAIHSVLQNGIFTLGETVVAFEQEFAKYIGTKHAVGVASGTDALTLSLRALRLSHDSEVIIPANAYPTAFGVALSNVRIKLVDCDEKGLLDVNKLAGAITKKTKVIVPVHLYGNPVDLATINRLIDSLEQKIYVVEDAAQAHGAEIKMKPFVKLDKFDESKAWRKVGSIGDIGCFSFYPTKNLGAYGDGGMVVTDNDEVAAHIRRLRMYGEEKRYESLELSGVSRLDELQAAILRVKLQYLDKWNARRKKVVQMYSQGLENIADITFLIPQDEQYKSSYHLCVIRTKKRDALHKCLLTKDIQTLIHYPKPIHLTPAFACLGYHKGDFPVAERLSKEILSLPNYPELRDNEIEYVIDAIKAFFG